MLDTLEKPLISIMSVGYKPVMNIIIKPIMMTNIDDILAFVIAPTASPIRNTMSTANTA